MIWHSRRHQHRQIVCFLLLFGCICCNIESDIFRVHAIRVNLQIVVASHCGKQQWTVAVNIAICSFWPPVASIIDVVFVAQCPRCFPLAFNLSVHFTKTRSERACMDLL